MTGGNREGTRLALAWLAPERVVLVGASARAGSVGKAICDNLRAGTGAFALQTVNPRPLDLPGTEHFTTLADLPSGPGLAVVAIPAAAVAGSLRELGSKGIRLAVVITAGLGRESAPGKAMLAAAEAADIRLIGPNCLGLILPHHGLNASFARDMPAAGDLALVSQSGAIATAMVQWARPRGIGFSAVVSVGDMAQTGMDELITLLASDHHTRAILIYLEGLNNGPAFIAAARAAACAKPVIVLKAGRSRAASKATLSHTGALAGAWDVYRAALRKAGAVVVATLDGMFNAASLMDRYPDGAGERLAIITNGGGAGILALDALAGAGGVLAELGAGTLERLDGALACDWSRGNPVDIIGDADGARYAAAIDAVIADEGVDALLVMNCPTGVLAPGEAATATADTVRRWRKNGGSKPVFACWLGDGNRDAAAPTLQAARIPLLATPSQAVTGFGALVQARKASARHAEPEPPAPLQAAIAEARALIARVRADGRRIMSEIEAKQLLHSFGIPVVETRKLSGPDDIASACQGIAPPYALKIVSPDITHKSDFGGVALGLADQAAVKQAAEAMRSHIATRFPDARIEGFALQPMIARKSAHELFVGIATDATFGQIVLFGAGGTAIEVIADKAIGIPPLSAAEARAMIAETAIARLLGGYRHVPPADCDAIAGVIVALSRMATGLPEIAELDVNPLLADAQGVIALDARVVLA